MVLNLGLNLKFGSNIFLRESKISKRGSKNYEKEYDPTITKTDQSESIKHFKQ